MGLLNGDARFPYVRLLLRRPIPELPDEGQFDQRLVDFERLDAYRNEIVADTLICCIGTTLKAAGSRAAFRRVDYEYVYWLARTAKQNGAKHFILVSAYLANPRSPLFYSRTKGELERDLKAIGFESLDILQPSMLIGERQEKRWNENLLRAIATPIDRLIPYNAQPIPADVLAKKIIDLALKPETGVHIHVGQDLRRIE